MDDRKTAWIVFLTAAFLYAFAAIAADGETRKYFRECPECPELVVIPAGEFVMGSPADEPGRFDQEGPRHRVTVRSFAMSKHEVTVEEFLTFLKDSNYQPLPCNRLMGFIWRSLGHGLAYPPGSVEQPDQPAVCVNWDDAQAYAAWLNDKIGAKTGAKTGDGPYRLPSEAEWEYAARAGSDTARWWGNDIGVNNANCNGCGSPWDNKAFARVDSFGPNPFGLYDMLGNVWQWTGDCWNETYLGAPGDGTARRTGDCSKRVLRGGSWSNLPVFVRSAARVAGEASRQDFDNSTDAGFRIARSIR